MIVEKHSTNYKIEENFLNLIKTIYIKSTTDMILNSERLKVFFPKKQNKTMVSALDTSIQYCAEGSSQGN